MTGGASKIISKDDIKQVFIEEDGEITYVAEIADANYALLSNNGVATQLDTIER